MGGRKYLGGANKSFIKDFSAKVIRVDEQDLKGYAAFVDVIKVHRTLVVDGLCLYDNGYSELNYLPEGEFWQLSAIYDQKGDIVEWYFDMTAKNGVDSEGKPYCDDLYLDAVLTPRGEIKILDEDELQQALDDGNITEDEFNLAHRVLEELLTKKIIGVDYMQKLCARLKAMF